MKMRNHSFMSLLFIFISILMYAETADKFVSCFDYSIDTYSGRLNFSKQGMVLKGSDLDININSFYNSGHNNIDRGSGYGWSGFDMEYEFVGIDSIRITKFNGNSVLYVWNGSRYVPEQGIYEYVEIYNLNLYKLVMKDMTVYYFENPASRKLTKVVDRNGNANTYNYDENGRISQITGSTGKTVDFVWGTSCIQEIIDNSATPNRVIYFTYGTAIYDCKYLSQITDMDGHTTTFEYNAGLISQITDGEGNIVNFSYNSNGVYTSVSCSTISYDFSYDMTNQITTVSNGSYSRDYYFDSDKRVTQIHYSDGYSEYFTYSDATSNITGFTDKAGNQITRTYDSMGNKLSETDAAGTITYTYDNTFNVVTGINDRNGHITSYNYDSYGNLLQISVDSNIFKTYTYNSSGLLSSSTDGNNNTINYTYDSNGNMLQQILPSGSYSYTYNGRGYLSSVTDANSNITYYDYNASGLTTSITNSSGVTSMTYNGNNMLSSMTDQNGNTTSYSYDVFNRLNYINSDFGVVTYQYDNLGNLERITDGNSHSRTYSYTSDGFLQSKSDAIGKTTSYSYDANGNVTSMTDANGDVITYSYDELNRMTSRSYNGNTDNYSYDNNGNLISASNNNISLSFTYDGMNRILTRSNLTLGKQITYTYDNAGNRATMTDPDGGLTVYAYDSMNRLTSITNPLSQVTTFTYDTGGRRIRQDNFNGTYSTYTYDNADRLTRIRNYNSSGSVMSSFTYTLDNNGNRLSMTDKDGGYNSYIYDNSNQITNVTYSDSDTEVYSYDDAGNRLSCTENGSGTTYTYDNADRMLSRGSVTYTYDDNGNMISKTVGGQTTTYSYDGMNRLVLVTNPDTSTSSFEYDPFGNRSRKNTSDGSVKRYLYDNVNPFMELNDAGSTTKRYTTGLSYDEWLSFSSGGSSYCYHMDGVNSTSDISSTSGDIVKSYEYSVFGNIRNESGILDNTIRYTGREYDSEVGLYNYRSRMYDANAGRFLTKDAAQANSSDTQMLNKYNYVKNNPVLYFDPLGESFWDKLWKYGKPVVKEIIEYVWDWITKPKPVPPAPKPPAPKPPTPPTKPPAIIIIQGNNNTVVIDGNNYGDGSLPVTLSTFNAVLVNEMPVITWRTETETDNMGWNVHRGENADALKNSCALKLNIEMIPGAGTCSIPTEYMLEDDNDIERGTTYWYWIEEISLSGNSGFYGPLSVSIPDGNTAPDLPQVTDLFGNYPNPFNPATMIKFDVKEDEEATLSIFNLKGQMLIEEKFKEGYHEFKWDAEDYGSGVYLYRLKSESVDETHKMVMIK